MFLPTEEWHIYRLSYVVHISLSVVNMIDISIYATVTLISLSGLKFSLVVGIDFAIGFRPTIIRTKVIFFSTICRNAWEILLLALDWFMAVKTDCVNFNIESFIEELVAIHNQSIYSTTFSWFCKP